jgi:(4-(4-[2-(gamma-L-glutamylamino)ethyl]phenoxymethyl)furan-2-yl)methanamine synthase
VKRVVGWDIGGANLKVAHVAAEPGGLAVRTASRPFEIWRAKGELRVLLQAMVAELPAADLTAVTMTAELSDAFRTKREGVGFVLDAVTGVGPEPVRVLTTAGAFVDVPTARARPLEVAAANWVATASLVARRVPAATLLVDVGSTTADVVPIQGGCVVARGRTDPERLLAGELVYTGALRTPVAAIVAHVPLRGGSCPVASEWFAVSGDVHVLLGDLDPEEYTCPTPDGRPATPEYAAERLARVVCADVEMLHPEEIRAIALAVAEAQERQIAAAIAMVAARVGEPLTVVTTGQGAFLARRAAARAGLPSQDLAELLGVAVDTAAPAVAVAWLCLDRAAGEPR